MSYNDFEKQIDGIRKDFEYDDRLMALEINRLRNALETIRKLSE